jgi:hypothetical protein
VQSLTSGFSSARWKQRPFRAPHHTASGVALVGGGCDFQKLLRHFRNKCDKSVTDLFRRPMPPLLTVRVAFLFVNGYAYTF